MSQKVVLVYLSIYSVYTGPEKVGKHASGACRQQPSFVGTEGLREGKKRKKKKEKKGEEK